MGNRKPRCVLCQTCANWQRGESRERRRSPRMCSAGLNPTTDLYECGSYVSRVLLVVPLRPARMAQALLKS